MILETLFRVTPRPAAEKRKFIDDVGLDRDYLKITVEEFQRDARNWLAKFNTFGLGKQNYPVFVVSTAIYASKKGEKVLLTKDTIIDCNATYLYLPSLSKTKDNLLPLEISYTEMKRWKSQTKNQPNWIQIQLHAEWSELNENISYLEFHLEDLQLEKLEKILRDKNIVL
jgi:hypothetical protein